MKRPFKKGDIVRGPSIDCRGAEADRAKIRTWRLITEPIGYLAIGQNMRARRAYRHPLNLKYVKLVKGAD
jgi:hypothetical protein